jgi:transcriptional regulator GlxA family with amidase domain
MSTKNIAILLFEEVELLDFCGPLEVFSVAARRHDPPAFNVYTVAQHSGPVATRNGLSVNPHFPLDGCPPPHILLIPGGMGTRRELHNQRLLDWIQCSSATAEFVLSVCTGALLLGKLGLLDGLDATTHHGSYSLLREVAPHAIVHEGRRYLDNGRVITSAGIAAGIDMSLHVVARLLGAEEAAATAKHMEYPWEESGER